MVELSLADVIENEGLPITVRVTRPCLLRQEEVLKKGQFLSIMENRLVQLLVGKDWNGKEFRINTDDSKSLIVQTVDIFYPKNIQEIIELIHKVSFIQLKNKFGFGVEVCEIGERFIYSSNSEHVNSEGERTLSFIREANSSIVHLPLVDLMKENLFVFVLVKEKLNLQTLLRSFQPQHVRFVNTVSDKELPRGVVLLESVLNYDSALSSTMISPNVIRYELFPIHKRILVEKTEVMPQYIQTLGETSSDIFQNKIKEILFLMYFDIYAGRLYGYVDMENPLQGADLELVDSTWYDSAITIAEERPTVIFDLHDMDEDDSAEGLSSSQFGIRRRPTTLISSAFASFKNLRTKKKPVTRSKSECDSHMAFEFIKGDTGIGDMTGAISQQKKILERISQGKQPMISPEGIKNVNLKKTDNIHTSFESLETENPIYGYDTLSLSDQKIENPLKAAKTSEFASIKSKPLSNDDLIKRVHSSPFSMRQFSSPDDPDALSQSFPAAGLERRWITGRNNSADQSLNGLTEDTLLIASKETRRSEPIFVPLNDSSKKVLRFNSRSPVDGVNNERRNISEGCDSGIDSPDVRKSLDNIYKNFEKRNSEENNTKSQSLDRERTVSVAEKVKQLEGNMLNQTKPIKRQPMKSIRSFGKLQISPKLSKKSRSQSEPHLDSLEFFYSDNQLHERPHSVEFQENTYAELIYDQIKSPPSYCDMEQKREVESINEIKALDLQEVINLLTQLGLAKYKTSFENQMIKGELLYKINETAFHKELNMTKFEARKLYKYIHGWRPCHRDLSASSLKYAVVKSWSVTNVRNELTGINLRQFATFCAEHDVDGHFLHDFVEYPQLLESLSSSHGIRLTSIETERFRLYINRKLDYSDTERRRALTIPS